MHSFNSTHQGSDESAGSCHIFDERFGCREMIEDGLFIRSWVAGLLRRLSNLILCIGRRFLMKKASLFCLR